jgi:hypothetical protein
MCASIFTGLQRERANVTVIDRGFNAYVGPGTNCAIDQGGSDYIVYLCAKEGFVLQHGWERAIVDYLDSHPEVGLAGTLGYSPSYLKGADYPRSIESFSKFRNPGFAAAHPGRIFRHVQGGLFAMRRAMYDQIGGFSEAVPHAHTDVEYSYYVESCGWKLGSIPGVLALYAKTRPPLLSRFDEETLVAHPPALADLPALDALVDGKLFLCNVCFAFLEAFAPGRRCTRCGSDPRARTLMRALAESTLTYRRLTGLFIAPPAGLDAFLAEQFKGPRHGKEEILAMMRPGSAAFAGAKFDVAYLGWYPEEPPQQAAFSDRIVQALVPGATLMVSDGGAAFAGHRQLTLRSTLRYASRAVQYDWSPLHVFERTG